MAEHTHLITAGGIQAKLAYGGCFICYPLLVLPACQKPNTNQQTTPRTPQNPNKNQTHAKQTTPLALISLMLLSI